MPFPLPVITLDHDMKKLGKAVLRFRAINNLLRQKILSEINEKGSCTVMYLQNKLQLDQAATSQHLAILRREDLVTCKRQGQCISYSINAGEILHLYKITENLLQGS